MDRASNFLAIVVDDEETVREITGLILEEYGGEILLAKDGAQALELFRINQGKVDLVFIDFSMPGKNGYEVFSEMKALDRTVGYIMSSGLNITADVAACQRLGEIEFVSKPFSESELINAARRVLKNRHINL